MDSTIVSPSSPRLRQVVHLLGLHATTPRPAPPPTVNAAPSIYGNPPRRTPEISRIPICLRSTLDITGNDRWMYTAERLRRVIMGTFLEHVIYLIFLLPLPLSTCKKKNDTRKTKGQETKESGQNALRQWFCPVLSDFGGHLCETIRPFQLLYEATTPGSSGGIQLRFCCCYFLHSLM